MKILLPWKRSSFGFDKRSQVRSGLLICAVWTIASAKGYHYVICTTDDVFLDIRGEADTVEECKRIVDDYLMKDGWKLLDDNDKLICLI